VAVLRKKKMVRERKGRGPRTSGKKIESTGINSKIEPTQKRIQKEKLKKTNKIKKEKGNQKQGAKTHLLKGRGGGGQKKKSRKEQKNTSGAS